MRNRNLFIGILNTIRTPTAFLGILVLVTGYVLTSRGAVDLQRSATSDISGQERLISIDKLPEANGAMCPVESAGAQRVLLAALQQDSTQDSTGGQAAAAGGPAQTVDFSQRKPERMIRDPYSSYSAVAVDPIRNEVALTDENLFQVLVYDRTANTPVSAKMTEPKRIIGGLKTRIEFQCGLYIDPVAGDIYAVNNDTVNSLVIFDRQAKGNTPPTRELHTPHRTFGIAVDEKAQELFLTIQHDDAVVVFHKNAENDDAPIRLVQGNQTQMHDAHGIALDPVNQVMFVSNYGSSNEKSTQAPSRSGRGTAAKPNWPLTDEVPGTGKFFPPSITVYPMRAAGDIVPLRVIEGSKTQLDWPSHLAFDPQHQELYVANDMGNSILVFSATANGDVAPIRVLKGPKTMIKNPTGVFLDLKNDELWVASFGNHAATVFRREASGDVAPLRIIRSGPLGEPALGIGNPHPVGYDSKRDEILVPN
jgi:DNA-binding beta-propeller fold protein YncE